MYVDGDQQAKKPTVIAHSSDKEQKPISWTRRREIGRTWSWPIRPKPRFLLLVASARYAERYEQKTGLRLLRGAHRGVGSAAAPSVLCSLPPLV